MSTFLFVRAQNDLRAAVDAVNKFLVHRRQTITEPCEEDRVLGIWLRSELEHYLPILRLDDPSGGSAVGIRESCSMSQLWTLSWMNGKPLCEAVIGRFKTRHLWALQMPPGGEWL